MPLFDGSGISENQEGVGQFVISISTHPSDMIFKIYGLVPNPPAITILQDYRAVNGIRGGARILMKEEVSPLNVT